MSTFIEQLIHRPTWMADAECRGSNSAPFFPGRGEDISEARAICRRCDVQLECLAYAVNNEEKFGIWGGTSEHERRTLRRQTFGNARPSTKPPRICRRCENGIDTGTLCAACAAAKAGAA